MSIVKHTGTTTPLKTIGDIIPGLGKLIIDDNTNTNIGTIFIPSGTGVIGYRVALSLLHAGITNVRVGIWFGDRQVCIYWYI